MNQKITTPAPAANDARSSSNEMRLLIEPALNDRGMLGFQGVVIDKSADEVFRGECHVDEEAAFHDAQRERDEILEGVIATARAKKFSTGESDEAKQDFARRCSDARAIVGGH